MNVHVAHLGYVDPSELSPVDSSACGVENPCGWWDDIYVRDACLNYLATCNPSSSLYIGATQGGITAATNAIGDAASNAAAQTLNGSITGLLKNPAGMILLVALAVYILKGK